MLLTIGPIFILDVSSSAMIVPILGAHFQAVEHRHTWVGLVVSCGILNKIISIFIFPIYIWIIFHLLRNRVPRILCRLGFGLVFYFLGFLSIFILDIVGHAQHPVNEAVCIFNFTYNLTVSDGQMVIPDLNMHWTVYIPTNLLFGIGPVLVTVTVFEFISAQSPHSMKGCSSWNILCYIWSISIRLFSFTPALFIIHYVGWWSLSAAYWMPLLLSAFIVCDYIDWSCPILHRSQELCSYIENETTDLMTNDL